MAPFSGVYAAEHNPKYFNRCHLRNSQPWDFYVFGLVLGRLLLLGQLLVSLHCSVSLVHLNFPVSTVITSTVSFQRNG